MKANVARRLRGTVDLAADIATRIIVCPKCAQRFAIRVEPDPGGVELAEKQAVWVADQLVWDHIQERKHHGAIDLPNLSEISAIK